MTSEITLEGRQEPWTVEEYLARLEPVPKLELLDGRLYGAKEQAVAMLAVLLEEVGAARAVRLGSPEVWCRAVAEL